MNDKFLAEWVSVEDRLPRHGKEVLIKSGDELRIGVFRVKVMSWSIDGYIFSDPTHWLELIPISE